MDKSSHQNFTKCENDSHHNDSRTRFIVRLIKRQLSPAFAEATAFEIFGSPLTTQDNGGGQNA